MNEDQKQPVADATKTQPTVQATSPKQSTATPTPVPAKPQTAQSAEKTTDPKQPTATDLVKPQAVQPTAPTKAPDTVKSQPTGNTAPTAPAPVKPQPTQAAVQTPDAVTPQSTQTTEVPKLSDVVPTSKVWISGLIGNRQIDCLGPIEIPLKIDEPTYPFTPVPSNPDYTTQVFDYATSTWVPTDAKSQGQQLTDLTKEVANLQQIITKHEKDAEVSQAMSLQQMQMLTSITAKLDALTKKEGVK